MDSLSHDPAAGDIGSQLVEIGSRGLAAGNAATMPTMTGLVPAGGEEVSAQAVMAFATADRHVGNPHPRVRLDVVDIRQLRLDREGPRAVALRAGQRQRIQPAPAAARYHGRDHHQGQADPHEPPPGGIIMPRRPVAGSTVTAAAGSGGVSATGAT